ncbi:YbfB/YjiJ family MFS transporter [Tistrella mobilis]|uniref:Major facilitator superfamily MFS_1 n=1 Tax=Tistrella mobilis (strain KA081020-065) TaxID=1110502 RepID=I3TX15_TISMK|nr:YbfB/YjiJ family MFS transporter [Tistrella mobilis]AFK57303.1 major facilitator superfamily MFS_1 [Tistrella mobilis KA081020-065]
MTENPIASGGSRAADSVEAAPPAMVSLRVAAGLAMMPAVSMALGRFAYALLLPSMRSDLGWSFTEAGAMNAASGLGFVIGALIAAPVIRAIGGARAFMIGGLITAATLFCSGLTGLLVPLLVLRTLGGATGAVAFIAGSAIAAAAGQGGGPGRAPLVLGIYFGGGGLGVVVSALIVPPLVAAAGWQAGWFALGLLSFAAMAIAAPALARAPHPGPAPAGSSGRGWSIRFMAPQIVSYALYGLGYIAYATYIVAYLRDTQHFLAWEISLFWALVGIAAMIGAFAWGPVLARLRGGWGSVATIGVTTLAAAIPLFFESRGAAWLSAILFGGAFLAAVAAMTACVRRNVDPHGWTHAIGFLTVGFAAGQSIGPLMSGLVADGADGIRAGLMLSILVMMAAILAAAFQRERSVRPRSAA